MPTSERLGWNLSDAATVEQQDDSSPAVTVPHREV
jgi:hypothetical protein